VGQAARLRSALSISNDRRLTVWPHLSTIIGQWRTCRTPVWDLGAAHPPYLPEPLKLDVAENSAETTEPLLFYMSFGRRSDEYPAERRQPLEHATGFKQISGVRIALPSGQSSSKALQATERIGLVTLSPGPSQLAEVTFDAYKQGTLKDFRPELPLLFRW
jgi:hypothetical protein